MVSVTWFHPLLLLFFLPVQFALHAGRCTLSSFCGGRRSPASRRRPRRTTNLRLRRLFWLVASSSGVASGSRSCLGHQCDPAVSCRLRFANGGGTDLTSGSSRPVSSKFSKPRWFNLKICDPAVSSSQLAKAAPANSIAPSDSLAADSTTVPSSADSFLATLDAPQHAALLNKSLSLIVGNPRCRAIPSADPGCKHILAQAHGLKSTLNRYDQQLPSQDPSVCLSSNEKELPVAIDTGASCSATPDRADFTGKPAATDTDAMEGPKGEQSMTIGAGPVKWDMEDVNGARQSIETIAHLIPDAQVRLFSPQTCFQEQQDLCGHDLSLLAKRNEVVLQTPNRANLVFPIQTGNRLPLMLTHKALHPKQQVPKSHLNVQNRFTNFVNFPCAETFAHFAHGTSFAHNSTLPSMGTISEIQPIVHGANWNPTEAQRELLLWHNRLGHISPNWVQRLLAKPRDPNLKRMMTPSDNKASHCPHPLCEACQHGKQKRRNPPSQKKQSRVNLEGALSIGKLNPGDRVSVDICQSPTRGRLPDTLGKEKTDEQCAGGAIFIDHATRCIQHKHQFTSTAAETVNSKHAFESLCDSFGTTVEECVADNHPFHSKDWVTDCLNQQQKRQCSGVRAHHQMLAERAQQTIFHMARTVLLHCAIHWPQTAHPSLWPFAADQAVCIWNHPPSLETRCSPAELFQGIHFRNHNHLQRLHVFGCPVCVLDPRSQDGKKTPKWERRGRRGVCLGVSQQHSSTVHPALSPETGKITPQHHVVFDDCFSTVHSDGNFNDAVWDSIVASNLERHRDAISAPDADPFHFVPPMGSQSEREKSNHDTASPTHTTETEHPLVPSSAPEGELSADDPPVGGGGAPSPPPPAPPPAPSGTFPSPEGASPSPEGAPASPQHRSPILWRSTRTRNPVQRLSPNFFTGKSAFRTSAQRMLPQTPAPSGSRQTACRGCDQPERVSRNELNQSFPANLQWDRLLRLCQTTHSTSSAFSSELKKNLDDSGHPDCLNPALPATMANKEDNPTHREAMAGPDAAGFIQAMIEEIETLTELDVFDIADRPTDQKVPSGVWAHKRKRFPDGSVRKLKARHCARGFEQQHGVDCFETFAPVVVWMTVRLPLIVSALMNLETKQMDCTAAFVHAPIDCTVHVEMPKGFAISGKVWKLKKSLHGLAQSRRNFFQHAKKQLTSPAFGFVQSEADPCPFISKEVICSVCVDDALPSCKDPDSVERFKKKMDDAKVAHREEEDTAGFLGVHTDRHNDGTMHLTQSGLTKQTVDALHLQDEDIKPLGAPCSDHLPIDEFGEPAHEEFSCPSVVGQLNCLAGHTRSDMALATSQVARFAHKPKRTHELAVIQIGRCLKGTTEKGLALKPASLTSPDVDVCVDAASACGWGTEEGTNPDSVKSRTGHIMEMAGCPVLWVSKLQTTIATSTVEAECAALSMALRAAMPLIAALRAAIKGLNHQKKQQIQFKATAHEDNQGALILGKLEPGRHTPRSKFHALRLHWFRSWLSSSNINLEFTDTANQKADCLTKPLPATELAANRKLSMGWQNMRDDRIRTIELKDQTTGRILSKFLASVEPLKTECHVAKNRQNLKSRILQIVRQKHAHS